MPCIKDLLDNAVNRLQLRSDSALLDSELLLSKVLSKDRTYLRAWPDREITPEQHTAFNKLLDERFHGKPIAYIFGEKEFWSRNFQVTPAVLIPRPETELLIELSLTKIPTNLPFSILDLGTGSGIIAITLAAERPRVRLTATDISHEALHVARANAKTHRVEHNIRFFQSDWFNNIPLEDFDMIISNPPYITENDPHLHIGDLRFEPSTALSSANQGLADITKIANTARHRLKNNGYLMIEHGYNQAEAVQDIFKCYHYMTIQTHTDLAGRPRVTSGQSLP